LCLYNIYMFRLIFDCFQNEVDCGGRYDSSFAPNVALSVEPFEEVRKQRAMEQDWTLAADDDDNSHSSSGRIKDDYVSPPPTKRRRRHRRPVDDAYDDDDAVSVSSDKREWYLTRFADIMCQAPPKRQTNKETRQFVSSLISTVQTF